MTTVQVGGDEIFHPHFLILLLYNDSTTMSKIYNIHYVDAYYLYDDEIGETKLSPHEAYGYMEKNNDNLVIIFIKKVEDSQNQIIVKGLVIPNTALISALGSATNDILLRNIEVGSRIKIEWQDIVYVANILRRDCSVMYTEGVLVKIEKDHIVIKNPETIRTYPRPVQNHPGGGLPTYLVLPISFITDISEIK